MSAVGTGREGRAGRVAFAAACLAEAAVAGLAPVAAEVMLRSAEIAHRFADLPELWRMAAGWALGAGVVAGVGAAAAAHLLLRFARAARDARGI